MEQPNLSDEEPLNSQQVDKHVIEKAKRHFEGGSIKNIDDLIKVVGSSDSLRLRYGGSDSLGLMYVEHMHLHPFLREVDPSGEFYILAREAGVKAGIDYVLENIDDAVKEDLGHTLGKPLESFSLPAEVRTEGLRRLIEFWGQMLESGGRFERASKEYRISFPEKYAEKLSKVNLESKSYPSFSESELTDEGIKQKFLAVIEEIKDDPIMKIDARSTIIGALNKCKEIIESV